MILIRPSLKFAIQSNTLTLMDIYPIIYINLLKKNEFNNIFNNKTQHMKHLVGIFFALCLFVLVFFGTGTVIAQQVVSTAGNHSENGQVQLSWTIGEPVISTFSNESNILTQGMHQSKLLIDAIEEIELSGLKISAFPNPTNEFINLQVHQLLTDQPDEMWTEYSFKLYDINGKILMQKQIVSTETIIQMDSYVPSTYFLKVLVNKNEIKIFKIIKQ
jgi:hypothetical protein